VIAGDVRDALEAAIGAQVTDTRSVSGGDINQAARVTFGGGETCLLKWKRGVDAGFFEAEAHGLRELAAAEEIRVPRVLAVGERGGPAFLAIEWIERGSKGPDFAERFGRALAALHHHEADTHGLDRDNYIGAIPQINTPRTASWTTFYREQRVGAQMRFARERGRLPKSREAALTRLQDRLGEWLDDETMRPSLLHGDLWGGNYMVDANGRPVLIDPAVYYGHRETDLAMTELFGGFPPRFYAAYNEAYPLDGYGERRELYQLYHVLNHMNLFGGGYGSSADRIVQRYVG
jgi:fructosamine-3-kinase